MPDADYRIYLLAGVALFVLGFYSLLVQAHLLRRIMALNVMGSGVFLVYIALGAQTPGPIPDPVPHAMVLTGIVVSVCATGLALALADRVQVAMDRGGLSENTEAHDQPPGLGVRQSSAAFDDSARDPQRQRTAAVQDAPAPIPPNHQGERAG